MVTAPLAPASVSGTSHASFAATTGPATSGASAPFGGLLGSLIAQTGALDSTAQEAVTGLLSGSGVDVHRAMIATQRADIAFQLALEVRNKAVGAYQQMMQMQF